MGSLLLKEGQKIPASLKLFDQASNKFVRAFLYDEDGVQLPGSPLNLAHVDNGLYENDNIAMPNTSHVTAVYRVFDDAGFTVLSETYSDGVDLFKIFIVDQDVIDTLIEIKDKVCQLLADITRPDLIGEISEVKTLEANVSQDEKIEGILEKDSKLTGEISSDKTLTGNVKDESDLDGNLGC